LIDLNLVIALLAAELVNWHRKLRLLFCRFRSRKLYETAPDRYKQLAISDANRARGVARRFSAFCNFSSRWL